MTREELLARKKLMDTWLTVEQAEAEYKTQNKPIVQNQPVVNQPQPVVNNTPDWSIQWKLNDYAKANPNATADQIANTIKDQVWYNTKDDQVYNTFYDYYKPKTQETDVKTQAEQFKLDQDKQNAINEQQNIKNQQIEQEKLNSDPNFIYNQIQSWIALSPDLKNTPAFKTAQERITNLWKFEKMSSSDLAYSIWTWAFLPWSQVYEDLKVKNPNLVWEAEKLNSLNSVVSKKTFETQDMQTIISNKLLDMFTWNTEDLKTSLANNPEVVKLNENMSQKATELSELKDQIDNLNSDLEKQYSWTWATKWYLSALSSRENQDLVRAYNLKLNEYNTLAWTLERISNDVKYDIEQKQENEARQLQAMNNLYSITKDQTAMEEKYAYTYWDLNSTDPTIQNIAINNAIDDMFVRYPLPWMESKFTKTQKVKDLISKWYTPEQALQQVEQEIRNSDKYQTYIQSQYSQEATQDWTISDWKMYNKKTWEIKLIDDTTTWTLDFSQNQDLITKYIWEASFKNNNPTWITFWAMSDELKTMFDEAWIKYSKWTARPSAEWWNYVKFATVQDWLNAYRIALTQRWDDIYSRLKTWVWTSEWDSYATNLMEQAWIQKWDKFSEISEDQLQTLMSAQLQKESPNFYNELISQEQQEEKIQWYTDQQIEELAYLSELQSKNPSQAAKDMKELWFTPKDMARFQSWDVPKTFKQKQRWQSIVDKITSISELDWNNAVGKFDPTRIIGTQWAVDADTEITNLVNLLTLDNVWLLKWPMTDKDLEFIKNASTKLNTLQSNKNFEKNLVEAYNVWARSAWVPEIKKLSDIWKKSTQTTNDDDFDSFYNNKP